MHLDSPGLSTDLALLRLQGSTIEHRGDHFVVRTTANPTFRWGNFVLVPTRAHADEVDRWVSCFEAALPEAQHRAVAFARSGGDTEAWAARGYDVEGDVDLATTTVPVAADPPDGIHLRALAGDPDWEQSVHVGGGDTTELANAGQLDFERRRAAAQRVLVESGRARWIGAFDGDRLVARLGIVRLGDLARYQDVVTLASHRRQGIAGALVRAAGEWALEDPAVGELVIVAEEGGPAVGLYQRAGFAEVARHVGVSRAPV